MIFSPTLQVDSRPWAARRAAKNHRHVADEKLMREILRDRRTEVRGRIDSSRERIPINADHLEAIFSEASRETTDAREEVNRFENSFARHERDVSEGKAGLLHRVVSILSRSCDTSGSPDI